MQRQSADGSSTPAQLVYLLCDRRSGSWGDWGNGNHRGGFLATMTDLGGLPTLFTLSAVLRLATLLPLVLVREQRSVSLGKFWLLLLPAWWRRAPLEPGEINFQPLIVQELDSPAETSEQSSVVD